MMDNDVAHQLRRTFGMFGSAVDNTHLLTQCSQDDLCNQPQE